MYGGTAKTYVTWDMPNEPFKEDNTWYIIAINPKTKAEKKVRWYTDKAHAELMPNKATEFFGKHIGFNDENDYINCVRASDVPPELARKIFFSDAGKLDIGWMCRASCEGIIWEASKDTPVPPVIADKIFRMTWPQYVKRCRAYAIKINASKDNVWINMKTDE